MAGRVRGGPRRKPLNLRRLRLISATVGSVIFYGLCLAAILAVALDWRPI